MYNQKIRLKFFIFIFALFVFSYHANALTWQTLVSKNKNLFNSNIRASSTFNFVLNNIFATVDTLSISNQQSSDVYGQIISKYQRKFQDEFGDSLIIRLELQSNIAFGPGGKKVKYNDGNLMVNVFTKKGQKLAELKTDSIFFGDKSEFFLRINTVTVDSKLKELFNNLQQELESTSTQALNNDQNQIASRSGIDEFRQQIDKTLAEIMGKWILFSVKENLGGQIISEDKNKKSETKLTFDKFFRSLIKKPLGKLQLVSNIKYDGVNASKYSLSINKNQLANNIFDALKNIDSEQVKISDKQAINDFLNKSDIKTVELIIDRNNKKIYNITGQAKFFLDDNNQLDVFLDNQFYVKKINYLTRPQQFVEAEKVLGFLMFLLIGMGPLM